MPKQTKCWICGIMDIRGHEGLTCKSCKEERERERGEEDKPTEQKCRICGCTENKACHGSCSWVEFDLCSECL